MIMMLEGFRRETMRMHNILSFSVTLVVIGLMKNVVWMTNARYQRYLFQTGPPAAPKTRLRSCVLFFPISFIPRLQGWSQAVV